MSEPPAVMISQPDDRRVLLQRQLSIMWRLAEELIIGTVDDDLALWEPSPHVCTVHLADDGWVADWPDQDNPPLPDVTVAWLLWHIEWWWTDAIARINGAPPVPHQSHRWSGGTAGVVAAKQQWDEILSTADLDVLVDWVMPQPQPLWFIASWVNVELTKNLAEINAVKTRHGNARRDNSVS